MKKKISNTIWVMGVLALAGFCLSACDHELDIQQAYSFTVETMPVQKHIVKGQTAEIRCTLKRQDVYKRQPQSKDGTDNRSRQTD